MAEGNEQSALLGGASEKKPKRSRSASGPSAKRPPTRKSGGKRPTKSNDRELGAPSQGMLLEAPSNERDSEQTAVDGSVRDDTGRAPAADENTRFEQKPAASHRTNSASESNEAREMTPDENGRHRAAGEVVVEQPRPEPVYGEGLIEVSGKGFGFLRDPKRNYVQSPQDIFVTPEVVR
ncbi:MAG TPA: hypothetical protein VFO40_06110, partial [Chthoniobacterales bacterium]|nr:hypothetical protein [Chthoniobacterales bacterium]